MGFKKRVKNKSSGPPSRKQLRKDKRKLKKVHRNEYFGKKKSSLGTEKAQEEPSKPHNKKKQVEKAKPMQQKVKNVSQPKELNLEQIRQKEKNEQLKLEKEMNKQRKQQLVDANVEEDRNIKHLEKQLKLNKRKTKAVPKSFSVDGLDYLLEVCDSENMESAILAEKHLVGDEDNQFEEDLALMTGQVKDKTPSKRKLDGEHKGGHKKVRPNESSDSEDFGDELEEEEEEEDDDVSLAEEEEEVEESLDEEEEDVSLDEFVNKKDEEESIDEEEDTGESKRVKKPDGTWEDIYGRLRDKSGDIIKKSEEGQKYIPPAIRAKLEGTSLDKKHTQQLERLKKQLKGLMNRLAESNMHNIATQIEQLYMNNSRNDMNTTITTLILEAIISNVPTPERLLMEHVMLISILHANVGTEVGAHFLQTVVKKFDNCLGGDIEDKTLDNVVATISQLYNFKLFDSKLIYEVLDRLSSGFEEKDVECILLVLKSVGFSLRKDDSLALKGLIINLQKKAAGAADNVKDNPRVKFMLDILLAIKNNNVTKIPNYDTTYSEHLKKIMKGFIRKGNYISQLNISLDDLLKADERGKWWVVGSAWTGTQETDDKHSVDKIELHDSFSQKLLDLAKKQRMNTDTRRTIFCIIMSAEDYLDAFEKLLRLSLKNQQEREIIHVILHCCLQETKYNPYYALLAQKFCDNDRKYQMIIKYSIWDKVKTLQAQNGTQISNLAKFLSYLFLEKGLPISTLKVVEFGDLDKVTLRFMRQILLGILLHEDVESCVGVFEKIAHSEKLKMFRESLRLFIHHFLLRNLKSDDDSGNLLQARSKVVDKLLRGKNKL